MELGHDMVDPLLEERPCGSKIRGSWWHGKLCYGSHEKGMRKGGKKEGWWRSQEEAASAMFGPASTMASKCVSHCNPSFSISNLGLLHHAGIATPFSRRVLYWEVGGYGDTAMA